MKILNTNAIKKISNSKEDRTLNSCADFAPCNDVCLDVRTCLTGEDGGCIRK